MEIEAFENKFFFFLLRSVLDNFGFSQKSLRKEFFSETILDCLSKTQTGWINEKKMRKNHVTLPLLIQLKRRIY